MFDILRIQPFELVFKKWDLLDCDLVVTARRPGSTISEMAALLRCGRSIEFTHGVKHKKHPGFSAVLK